MPHCETNVWMCGNVCCAWYVCFRVITIRPVICLYIKESSKSYRKLRPVYRQYCIHQNIWKVPFVSVLVACEPKLDVTRGSVSTLILSLLYGLPYCCIGTTAVVRVSAASRRVNGLCTTAEPRLLLRETEKVTERKRVQRAYYHHEYMLWLWLSKNRIQKFVKISCHFSFIS